MPRKHTIDGRVATLIYGDLDEIMRTNLNLLTTALAQNFEGDHEAAMKTLVQAIKTSADAQEITGHLRAGRIKEAEAAILRRICA